MPLVMSQYMIPPSPYYPYLLEDIYLKGGFRVLDTLADRDGIHRAARKIGMLVHVIDDGKLYQLQDDLQTWEEAELGGGVAEVPVEDPLLYLGDGRLTVDPNRILPTGGSVGQSLIQGASGPMWMDLPASAGQRGLIEYESPDYINAGEYHDFSLVMAKTVMLLAVSLNAIGVQVMGYTSGARDDKNPFTFVSSNNLLTDEGIKEVDGEFEYLRRFSFMSNKNQLTTQYFRFTNLGGAPVKPKVIISYLSLE